MNEKKIIAPLNVFGDWLKIHREEDFNQYVDVLAEQAKGTVKVLVAQAGLKFPVSFGWKLREITPEDEDAARRWLEEQE